MAAEAGGTVETTSTFITTDPRHAEEGRAEVRSKHNPETENTELAVDHVYSQMFTIKMPQLDQFKESAGAYASKMLNHNDANYGIVFFKVQFYYDSDAKDSSSNSQQTCIMNFHLFSKYSIDEQKEEIIKGFVKEFISPFPESTVQLDSTQILVRANTQLRKPVVP